MTRPTPSRPPTASSPKSAPRAGSGIAFQGLPGAYSHLACLEAYPALTALPCASFEDAFAAVTDNKAALAMIPIENSVAGRVADIHHLLPDSGLYIVAEHFQRVRHHLLAPKGAKLERLKRVYSHPQALTQCRKTVRTLKLEAVARADTAGAAAEVAERGDPTEAAIASSLAGEIYGLDTVRSHLEDAIDNTTRFIVMSRHRGDPDPKAGRAITSFVFQVRSVPAALYKSLGGFATNGINVVKLESYIVDASFTVAQFYAEIEGHVADRAVDRAFDELKFYATKFKVLGVFPAHAFRREA